MSAANNHELDEIYAFAVQLGKDAGKMLMEAVMRRTRPQDNGDVPISMEEKESSVDIVTKTDHGVWHVNGISAAFNA